ncbi:DUF2202 domain-containing protein [Aquirufa antheringensis]|jgi:hypothetical protein|uniref:DUF2202 domain-containing protein n=1 Tax=Aquirufa antheringensis TaxID=2516559 RepID=A0A4Q9BCZ7_9BACT|nr:DUF2202 domain-containing protein [Aquirufa antheringensis]MCZ2488067.1 DUF2202 domain-containing protein [Aquirufa antheringensis]MCZ2490470.1 DUF2202 domain-containing protein [Aquirufa antheringensis]TBH69718.1 DUF2202 domain-containing protein [Aquirufa antheringensis]TBH72948.1 DUF2202 domain-containing protein [Aquirufa antheringensis]
MKKVLSFVAVLVFLSSCEKGGPLGDDQGNSSQSLSAIQATVSSLPVEPLDSAEKQRVLFIREEEKLAYDVYQAMFDKYGVKIFQNIPNSELSHMEAMLTIITKYQLVDPMDKNPRGVFANADLQSLYNALVSQGNGSILAAYQVGAKIEELDIFDLNKSIAVTNNQDVKLVYDFLNKGSRNHLRSFFKNLTNAGGTYTPVFITKAEFDAIVTTPTEKM